MKRTTYDGVTVARRNVLLAFFEEKRKVIADVISALFILLFAYTALNKLMDPLYFGVQLRQSPLIGQMGFTLAWVIIVIELAVTLLLLIPRTRLAGLYASLVLMVAFTAYVGYMLAFAPKLPCSCGGVISAMSWPQHLTFNIFFVLLALTGIRLTKNRNT